MGTELSSRMEERHHPRIGCVAVCAPAACWRIHHGVGQSGDGDLMSHSPGRGVLAPQTAGGSRMGPRLCSVVTLPTLHVHVTGRGCGDMSISFLCVPFCSFYSSSGT